MTGRDVVERLRSRGLEYKASIIHGLSKRELEEGYVLVKVPNEDNLDVLDEVVWVYLTPENIELLKSRKSKSKC